jgi:hypothetical protein
MEISEMVNAIYLVKNRNYISRFQRDGFHHRREVTLSANG